MANHKTFTDQDILSAAKSLEEAGKPVNGNALRQIVGSGRPSALIDTYKDLVASGKVQLPQVVQQENDNTIESYELPIEIKEELKLGLNALSSMVMKCNDLAHHVVEKRLNKAVKEANDARIAALKSVEDAEKNEETAWNQAQDAQDALLLAQDELKVSDKKIVELTAKNNQQEREVIGLNQTIASYKHELDISQKAVNAEKQKAAQEQGKANQLNSELDKANTSINELTAKNITLVTSHAKELGVIQGQLTSATKRAEQADKQRETDIQVVSSLKGDNQRQATEIEQLKIKIKELSKKLNTNIKQQQAPQPQSQQAQD